MKKYLLLIFSFMIVISSIPLKAQDDDSLETKEKHKWNWNWEWEREWDWGQGKPFIEFTYGIGEPKHDKLSSTIADIGLAGLKLGYVTFDDTYDDNVIEFDEKFIFASKLAPALRSDYSSLNGLKSEMLRFGFAKRSGYGYDFRFAKILPYHEIGGVWSKLDMKEYPGTGQSILSYQSANNINDTQILDRFDKNFRFGTFAEAGIRLELGRFISFNGAYEAVVIFPRHLVWKNLASLIIQLAGEKSIDNFIDEVYDSSPYAAPIVDFLLKNGYSYLFYTLQKKHMNWPFNTETPLTYETFKFGVTFTF